MVIDWQASKEQWIAEVEAGLLPKLLADARFDARSLPARFQHEVEVWKRTRAFRPLIEIGNELAAAECLLNSLGGGDRLTYEPAMPGTERLIDFHRLAASGEHEWVEVKTVAPQWVDYEADWKRFMDIAQAFPENAQLIVAKEWGGAAIAGQAIKARWSFVRRAAAMEAVTPIIPDEMKGPVWVLFCSTGAAWHPDELEDFADFYRTGRAREDDPMRNAVDRFMNDEGIRFQGALAGFHYLGRRHEETSAHDFRMNVEGPNFGR